jgi:phosphatidylserine/phosphatidylglycerophosphate/cardiolipin synthase-like enzyme
MARTRRRAISARALAPALALTLALALAPAAATAGGGGGLALLMEPSGGITPIYHLIDSARHSVELEIYELADMTAEQSLAGDAARGVRVQVILDGSTYTRSANQPAFTYLAAHDVAVRWAPREFDLTHEKAIVVDGAVAAIMTLNLQSRYYTSTRDFALIDTQPGDVDAIAATFEADWAGRPIAPRAGAGDLLWSPGAQPALLSLIASARHSLDIESEEMDSAAVEQALAAAARRGVAVRLVMTYSSEYAAAIDALATAGVQVRLYAPDAALYIHAKLIDADGTRLFLGSQNFSTASLDYNRELGVISANRGVIAGVEATFDSDFAGGGSLRGYAPPRTGG